MGKLYVEASSVGQHLWGLNGDRLGHTLKILILVTTLCLNLRREESIDFLNFIWNF